MQWESPLGVKFYLDNCLDSLNEYKQWILRYLNKAQNNGLNKYLKIYSIAGWLFWDVMVYQKVFCGDFDSVCTCGNLAFNFAIHLYANVGTKERIINTNQSRKFFSKKVARINEPLSTNSCVRVTLSNKCVNLFEPVSQTYWFICCRKSFKIKALCVSIRDYLGLIKLI